MEDVVVEEELVEEVVVELHLPVEEQVPPRRNRRLENGGTGGNGAVRIGGHEF